MNKRENIRLYLVEKPIRIKNFNYSKVIPISRTNEILYVNQERQIDFVYDRYGQAYFFHSEHFSPVAVVEPKSIIGLSCQICPVNDSPNEINCKVKDVKIISASSFIETINQFEKNKRISLDDLLWRIQPIEK